MEGHMPDTERQESSMASQAATKFTGNMNKATTGLRRYNLEGLQRRVFDAKGQDQERKPRIFPGSKHSFGDRLLQIFAMPPREVREMRTRVRRAMIRALKKAEQQLQSGNDSKKGKKRESKEEGDTA